MCSGEGRAPPRTYELAPSFSTPLTPPSPLPPSSTRASSFSSRFFLFSYSYLAPSLRRTLLRDLRPWSPRISLEINRSRKKTGRINVHQIRGTYPIYSAVRRFAFLPTSLQLIGARYYFRTSFPRPPPLLATLPRSARGRRIA